jgi:hypothetical protein
MRKIKCDQKMKVGSNWECKKMRLIISGLGGCLCNKENCPKLRKRTIPKEAQKGMGKDKISGASGFERGASCVKCLKPLSTTRGGGQPEDFWHEYYKDIITQIHNDHKKEISELQSKIKHPKTKEE